MEMVVALKGSGHLLLIICFRSTAHIAILDHYYDVMPLLHHICNIFMQAIKSVFSKLMNIVIQDTHFETMASNLIVNVIVIVELLLLYCHDRLSK